MTERLPGAAGAINTVEASGDLIKKHLCLLFAAGEDAFQIDLVVGMFRQFVRAANRQLNKFTGRGVGILVQLVKGPLAIAPRLHEAGVLQQAEVRGNARLAEPRDFLEFGDGQFVAFQQRDDAQPRRVGQRAKRFEGGGHVVGAPKLFQKTI